MLRGRKLLIRSLLDKSYLYNIFTPNTKDCVCGKGGGDGKHVEIAREIDYITKAVPILQGVFNTALGLKLAKSKTWEVNI